jgi:PAS domain S-box-containing protein
VSDDTELPSMLVPPAPAPGDGQLAQALAGINHRMVQAYLWATSASFALVALVVAAMPVPTTGGPLDMAGWVCAAVAVLVALAALGARDRPRLAVALCSLLALAGIGASAEAVGWGVATPGFGFVAIHAAMAMALAGGRVGSLVTGAALALVALLAIGQARGWYPVTGPVVHLWMVVLMQSLLVVLAAAGGWLAARFVVRFMREADDREHRFQRLLHIAADAYWELDPHYAVQDLSPGRGPIDPAVAHTLLGRVPWEHPDFGCDADVLDRLQADLGARQPFRDVAVEFRLPAGPRQLMISGEPRFCANGMFRGYWGVARDVTDEQRARAALVQTEARYQDLFASIPTALVLHRSGVILDANPAAAVLFGYADEQAMVGADLLASYEGTESRERAAGRIQQLLALPAGQPLPVSEFQLVSRQGRALTVRGTGVGVDSPQGRAVLSIFVDDTDRHAAEHAVRRSEALLSHLVASSPDIITLTDTTTGRYVMVNRSFEGLTGWAADEVVGRTAAEIGIWATPEDRERLVGQVREQGRVQDMPMSVRRRDGSVAPVLVSGARFAMDRRDYLVLNVRDMTEAERHRLEREAILDNASVGIALTRDRVFQMVNPAFETMLGWPDGSLIGQPGAVVWPSEAAYAELGAQIGPPLARGEQIEIECEVQRRDGSSFLCRMLARAVDPSHPSRGGTIWVVEDITERHRLTEALARARDAAEAANRAKSAFLANTSHELRTPLNGLLGLAQLARAPGVDESRRTRYLDQIVDSAQGLSMIVSDILDLAKIEAGRMTVEQAPFDLAALLQSVHRSHAALTAMHGLTLTLDAEPGLGMVRGDALRLRQILTNYLANAVKFTALGSVRLVARRCGGDRVRFEVHDTGPGIDAATQARLFEPFSQGDESTTRRYGGTGLGLSICRQLARLMGGQVGMRSQPGLGSCFWAELPLPAVDAASLPAPAVVEPADTRDAHVLMVDDNEVNMMVAVAQLEQFGVRVGQASDGRQALEAVAAAEAAGDPYDLVMMDLQMPELSGYEVTRELRRHHTPETLPIVAYTAAALVGEREAALGAGMNDFLPKPTDAEQLRAMIARWLRR